MTIKNKIMNLFTRFLSVCILFFNISLVQAQTYCTSNANLPWEQWNERVSIADGYVSSSFPTPTKQGYGDYTNLTPAKILKSNGNLITISPTSSWSGDPRNANMFWRVWVDFNGDGVFTSSDEQVISRQIVFINGIFLDNEAAFTPPSNAKLGITRMRISMKVGGYPEPCETFERGEVQDFTVEIIDGTINPSNYCASKSNAPWELWISKVGFNTINNSSEKFKDFATAGYSDYTNLSTTIQRGTTYLLNITPGLSWSGNLSNVYTKGWIDYNGDNNFDDAEAVIQYVGAAPFLPQIRIPNAAATGTVRMRVAVKWGSFPTSCETFGKGEVEDYSLSFYTGGNNNNSDIAVSIATVPNFFTKYQVLNFTTTANNTGPQSFSNVNVEFKFPVNTTNGGTAVTTLGTWNEWCAGGIQCFTWTIPNLPANTTAVMVVPVFVLNPSSPIVATTKLLSSTPTDVNVLNNTATVSINAAPGFAPLEQFQTTQLIPMVIEKISPNPTDGDLEIVVRSIDERILVLSFNDAYGKIARNDSRRLEKGINKLHYDVSELPQGIYFVSPSLKGGLKLPMKFVKM